MKHFQRFMSWGGAFALLAVMVLSVRPAPAQAASVTQLDISGGSISLNFGALGSMSGTFTQNG